ncbi:MAG TPA: FAD-binding domain-containing protein, partial [Coriobacteriia bacterium]|nr:FAD-binding domain-containing protein [Coriobacteriia bacterium]
DFAEVRLEDYAGQRDFPAEDSTSRLSPHLAWGELSPRQVAEVALEADEPHAAAFVRQLAWREFSYHVLHHNPSSSERPLDPKFEAFPWREDRGALESWKAGRTGFPLVDAGMRQLAASGWMHNRVRLLCASFLTKDLLVPWQQGEEHFRQQLVDYDPAINPFNWQWVAGSGADAAPYFRVFSPSRQAERFDPQAAYIREWVPELARLSERRAREPWRASREELADAGVSLGDTYPERIIDHAEARERALAAFSAIRRTG